MDLTTSLASLHLEVVVPVRAATIDELPDAGRSIGQEEKRTPAFVLLDVDSFMWTYGSEFFASNGQDDMAENDAAKWQLACQLAATSQAMAIGDFQCA